MISQGSIIYQTLWCLWTNYWTIDAVHSSSCIRTIIKRASYNVAISIQLLYKTFNSVVHSWLCFIIHIVPECEQQILSFDWHRFDENRLVTINMASGQTSQVQDIKLFERIALVSHILFRLMNFLGFMYIVIKGLFCFGVRHRKSGIPQLSLNGTSVWFDHQVNSNVSNGYVSFNEKVIDKILYSRNKSTGSA